MSIHGLCKALLALNSFAVDGDDAIRFVLLDRHDGISRARAGQCDGGREHSDRDQIWAQRARRIRNPAKALRHEAAAQTHAMPLARDEKAERQRREQRQRQDQIEQEHDAVGRRKFNAEPGGEAVVAGRQRNAEQGRAWNAADAVGTAGQALPIGDDEPDNLAERQRDDGEIIAAQPQHRKAQHDAPQRRKDAGERQADPERQAEIGREQRVGIGADGVKRGVAEVEKDVVQHYTTAESLRLAHDAAKNAAERARKGESLDSISKDYGLTVKTAAPFTIDGAAEGIGAAGLLSAAFKSNVGDVVGPIAAQSGQFVCKVAEKIPADMNQFEKNNDGIISKSEFTNPSTGLLYDPALFSAIDYLGGPLTRAARCHPFLVGALLVLGPHVLGSVSHGTAQDRRPVVGVGVSLLTQTRIHAAGVGQGGAEREPVFRVRRDLCRDGSQRYQAGECDADDAYCSLHRVPGGSMRRDR